MPAAIESTWEQISSREMPKALDIKKTNLLSGK